MAKTARRRKTAAKPSRRPAFAKITRKSRTKASTARRSTKARKRAVSARRKPAAKALHNIHFPNETARYRNARNTLLRAEHELRAQTEKIAALRRKLPAGGEVPKDYVFTEITGAGNGGAAPRNVRLSELFENGPTLVAYSFMYGPNMAEPCPLCSSMLDALNGDADHIAQRTNLVVIAKSPIERIRAFARDRGWNKLRFLSSAGTTYNSDYHGETPDGAQIPALNVFVKRNGKIHHFYNTELLFVPGGKNQDMRHVDPIWPLWNLLDFTPEGRGTNWYPQLNYGR
jgi:predicted dithiol-disulfide oxidoreductase (DUF899 family)